MKKAMLALAVALGAAVAQSSFARNIEDNDKDFVKDAAQCAIAESNIGALGVSRTKNAEVKKLGQQIVDDHATLAADLKSYATKKGYPYPSEANGAEKEARARLDRTAADEFDREFLRMMIDSDRKIVRMFESAETRVLDTELKKIIGKSLPTLKKHLESAEALSKKMGED